MVSFQAPNSMQVARLPFIPGHACVQAISCNPCAKHTAKHRPAYHYMAIGFAAVRVGRVQGMMPMQSGIYLRGWQGRLRRRC